MRLYFPILSMVAMLVGGCQDRPSGDVFVESEARAERARPQVQVDGEGACTSPMPVGCQGDAECEDGDSCTVDTCNDEVCAHSPVTCPAGQGCDPATGECSISCRVDELVDVTWELETYGPLSGDPTPVEPDESYALHFAPDGMVTGNADCNDCFGSYEVAPRCSIEVVLLCTEIACGSVPGYVESVYDVSRYEVEAGGLRLYFRNRFTGEDSVLVYRGVPD